MEMQNQRGDALFEELGKNKKRRRRRILTTVLAIILIAAVVLVVAVSVLRQRVRNRFGGDGDDILTYQAATGTLHTLVSGDGVLEEVDLETISVPAGVEIKEVETERNTLVKAGDLLATVDMSTVMQALSDTQDAIDDLDGQISDAEGDKVSTYIKSGVSGRIKKIYAEKGNDVTACMAEHGALAVLSLDGYMAVDLECDALEEGDKVTVLLPGGKEESGSVKKVVGNTATVLITDNGPELDAEVTVCDEDGGAAGSGKLYIHSPLRITGYAGTVKTVQVKENQKVSNSASLFSLTDTHFSTNYETLLRSREEQEEILKDLLTIYQDGAVLAPYDGLVSTVLYSDEEETSAADTAYSVYTATAAADTSSTEETELLTLTPNEKVQVTIPIGESDILSLEVGQGAEVTVASVNEEEVFAGTVTEVSKTADSSSGVTQYSAVVELEKVTGMLAGMSAEVGIQIEGVENAILVPVDAVHQTSAISFVYTGYDTETEQYTGMVEVKTGLWGDSYVEIISGLSVGDTVYYTEKQTFFFGFPGMNMGNMGGMGNAGSMPPGGMNGMNGMPGGRG